MPFELKDAPLSDEVIEFINNNYKGISTPMLVDKIKQELGIDIEIRLIKNYMKRKHLKNGFDQKFKKGQVPFNKGCKLHLSLEARARMESTQFKKGSIPPQHRPVGSTYVDKDGYVLVKIDEPRDLKAQGKRGQRCDCWKPLHRILWQIYHSKPIPKGHCVMFADGNRENYDIDNLILVSNGERGQMCKQHLISDNADITKVNLNIVRIEQKINKIKRKEEGTDDD